MERNLRDDIESNQSNELNYHSEERVIPIYLRKKPLSGLAIAGLSGLLACGLLGASYIGTRGDINGFYRDAQTLKAEIISSDPDSSSENARLRQEVEGLKARIDWYKNPSPSRNSGNIWVSDKDIAKMERAVYDVSKVTSTNKSYNIQKNKR